MCVYINLILFKYCIACTRIYWRNRHHHCDVHCRDSLNEWHYLISVVMRFNIALCSLPMFCHRNILDLYQNWDSCKLLKDDILKMHLQVNSVQLQKWRSSSLAHVSQSTSQHHLNWKWPTHSSIDLLCIISYDLAIALLFHSGRMASISSITAEAFATVLSCSKFTMCLM